MCSDSDATYGDERTVEIVNGLCRECLAECELDGPMPVYGFVPDTFLPGPRDGGGLPGADEVVDVTARVEELRRAAGLGRWEVTRPTEFPEGERLVGPADDEQGGPPAGDPPDGRSV